MKRGAVAWLLWQLYAITTLRPVHGADEDAKLREGECTYTAEGSDDATQQCSPTLDSGSEEEQQKNGPDVRDISGSSLPIMVLDDFLDESFVHSVFDIIGKNWTAWSPVNPNQKFSGIGARLFQTGTPMNGFPGLRHSLTDEYQALLRKRLLEQSDHISTIFGQDIQLEWNQDSFFGNVCYHPEFLTPRQTIPHTDRGLHHLSKFQVKRIALAMIHYINPNWKGTGGTAFYADRKTQTSSFLWKDCDTLRKQANQNFPRNSRHWFQASGCHCERPTGEGLCEAILKERGTVGNYTNDGNEHYSLVHHVPYRFNRAVLYAPQLLHSAYLDERDVRYLSCVPHDGRLTANVFISMSTKAQSNGLYSSAAEHFNH